MLKYQLSKNPYDNGTLFTGKLEREFESGLTVLVGCNGYGKSTIIRTIKETLSNDDYYIFSWDGLTDKQNQKDRMMLQGRHDIFASLFMSSEGEEININMGIIASQVGSLVRKGIEKDIVILLDGCDSGLSIDNIAELKDFLKELLIPDIRRSGHECYIVASANEYEMARNERCVDARTGKTVEFSDYEDFRKYILKTRKKKDEKK